MRRILPSLGSLPVLVADHHTLAQLQGLAAAIPQKRSWRTRPGGHHRHAGMDRISCRPERIAQPDPGFIQDIPSHLHRVALGR